MNGMLKNAAWVLAAGILLSAGHEAFGQALAEKQAAQVKLMAIRAARVDAMRKLAERINGLTITSETTVKDFVASDDRIRSSMLSWLSGMKEVGEPASTPDGVWQVTLEVTIREIITELKRLHKEFYKGNKVRVEDFDQMLTTVKDTTFRETGSGAQQPEFAPRGQEVPPGTSGNNIMSQKAWAYWTAHCTPRGRLMAERAARLDSYRKLGERINGLMISSETTVKDFVATNDTIRTQMATFLRGGREVGTRYHDNELIVEVEMEVTVAELVTTLQKWHKEFYKGNKVTSADIERLSSRVEEKDIREAGMGIPPDEYLKDMTPEATSAVTVAKQAVNWPPAVQATGQSAVDNTATNPAQAKLMAIRAAELDARRKLAEQLNGLQISSNTTVKDFVAMNDQIQTALLTFQQGARRVNGSEKFLADGTAQLTMEIDAQPLWTMVLYYQEKLALTVK
jgi:hypothetical protein